MKRIVILSFLIFLAVSGFSQENSPKFYVGARGVENFMSYKDDVINKGLGISNTFKDNVGTFSLAAGVKMDWMRLEVEFFHNGEFKEGYNYRGAEINGTLKSYGGLGTFSWYFINQKNIGVFIGAGIGGSIVKGDMSSPSFTQSDGYNKTFLVLALQTGFELPFTERFALEAMLRYYYMSYTESNDDTRKIDAFSPTVGLKYYF